MNEALQEFVRTGSEPAFDRLVKEHIDIVFSAAVRTVGGDRHLAEDVTQTVFVDLARKAKGLPTDVVLSAWLCRHTFFVASSLVRKEQRRKRREQEVDIMNSPTEDAWRDLEPELDAALNDLSQSDRDVVVLRFFEKLDLRTLGERVGVGEDAAQKRVSRALEKLRLSFGRRGLNVSAVGLSSALLAHAVMAAPATLTTGTASTVLASIGGGVGLMMMLKQIASMKLAKVLAGAGVVAGLAVPLVREHTRNGELQEENDRLAIELEQMNGVLAENERLARIAMDYAELERLRGERGELLELRGKATLLSRQNMDLQRGLDEARRQLAARDAADESELTEEEVQARRQVTISARIAQVPLDSDIWDEFGLIRPRAGDGEGGSVVVETITYRELVERLEEQEGIDIMFAPRVTTSNGRRTQISGVESRVLSSDLDWGDPIAEEPNRFSPTLDIMPTFAPNSDQLNLKLITSANAFIGYQAPGEFIPPSDAKDVKLSVRRPLPHYRILQHQADLNVTPGQVAVLTGGYGLSVPRSVDASEDPRPVGLIIIAAPTEIDPVGNFVQPAEAGL